MLLDSHRTKALYETMFQQALLIRLAEEKIIALYPSDVIQSPVHLSIGQEVVAVAACTALRLEDRVFLPIAATLNTSLRAAILKTCLRNSAAV